MADTSSCDIGNGRIVIRKSLSAVCEDTHTHYTLRFLNHSVSEHLQILKEVVSVNMFSLQYVSAEKHDIGTVLCSDSVRPFSEVA